MAIARPGLVVGNISGSIGGGVFRTEGGRQIISARRKPTRKESPALYSSRALLSLAGRAWSALPAATRDAWEAFAARLSLAPGAGGSRRRGGYGVFSANIVNQAGRLAPVQAAAPLAYTLRAECLPVVTSSGGSFWIQSLTRALASDETLLLTCMAPSRSGARSAPRRVAQVLEIPASVGLQTTLDNALSLVSAGVYPHYEGNYSATSVYTVEMWLKPAAVQTSALPYLFFAQNGPVVLFNSGTSWSVWDGITNQSFGVAAMVSGVWNHVAFVSDTVAPNFRLYVNGQAVGSGLNGTPRVLRTDIYFGQWWGAGHDWDGLMDEIVVEGRAKTGAEILADYNGGTPRRAVSDAQTLAIYHCDSATGGKLLNALGAGRELNYPAGLFAPGCLSPRLFDLAASPIGAGWELATRVRLGQGNIWLQPPAEMFTPLP